MIGHLIIEYTEKHRKCGQEDRLPVLAVDGNAVTCIYRGFLTTLRNPFDSELYSAKLELVEGSAPAQQLQQAVAASKFAGFNELVL